MSWSLEVFSPRREPLSIAELEQHLAELPPVLQVIFSTPLQNMPSDAPPTGLWSDLALSEDGQHIVARIEAIRFDTERDADPQLLTILGEEIQASDEEDGELDEEYTNHLRQLLEQSGWHYTLSVRQNGRPDQERAVVRAAYALSKIGGGIVHDLQSGAWMDADLFESLLDAYGVHEVI
ncbi:MAG TPA: hypothetical protein VF600_11695 [Abditibacteriaceae bacterium]